MLRGASRSDPSRIARHSVPHDDSNARARDIANESVCSNHCACQDSVRAWLRACLHVHPQLVLALAGPLQVHLRLLISISSEFIIDSFGYLHSTTGEILTIRSKKSL